MVLDPIAYKAVQGVAESQEDNEGSAQASEGTAAQGGGGDAFP